MMTQLMTAPKGTLLVLESGELAETKAPVKVTKFWPAVYEGEAMFAWAGKDKTVRMAFVGDVAVSAL